MYRHRKGFSLVEILVALSILTLIIFNLSQVTKRVYGISKADGGTGTGGSVSWISTLSRSKITQLQAFMLQDIRNAQRVYGYEGALVKNGSELSDLSYSIPLQPLLEVNADSFRQDALDSVSEAADTSTKDSMTILCVGESGLMDAIWHFSSTETPKGLEHVVSRIGSNSIDITSDYLSPSYTLDAPDYLPEFNYDEGILEVAFPNPYTTDDAEIVEPKQLKVQARTPNSLEVQ